MGESKLSKFEYLWQGVIFWAIIFTACEAPFSFTFKTKLQVWQVYSDIILSLIFIADLIVHLKKTRHLKKGWKDYSYLFIDLMACVPFDLIGSMVDGQESLRVFTLVRLFRLFRIIKIFSMFDNIALIPKYIKMQLAVVFCFVAVHWISCGWILFSPSAYESRTDYYVKAFYWAITTLTTIGYGDITPTTTMGRIYTMVIMILGVGVYSLVIGNVARLLSAQDRYKEQTKEKLGDLNIFMRHYDIPQGLQKSCFAYFNHKFNKRLSENDTKIIADLPDGLQHELKVYMNIKLIHNVPIFAGCKLSCLKAVASNLEQLFFSPGETIIKKGEEGNEMFIIGHGQVDVLADDGLPIAVLNDGQIFGEMALLEKTKRSAAVVASSYCDMYILRKDSFNSITSKYPELLENMNKIVKKRS